MNRQWPRDVCLHLRHRQIRGTDSRWRGTLLDGNPLNNFIERAATLKPTVSCAAPKALRLSEHTHTFAVTPGLVVVDISDAKPAGDQGDQRARTAPPAPGASAVSLWLCLHQSLHVLDTTNPAEPHVIGHLPLEDAHSVYLARTYAYVAAGHHGLVIVDITKPTEPFIDQVYNANGCIKDLHDVKLGITYTSEFPCLPERWTHGLHVVLASPDTHGNAGFSPRPTPQLVATYKLPKGGHALPASPKGLIATGLLTNRATKSPSLAASAPGR